MKPKSKLTIYCARPMTGVEISEVYRYYDIVTKKLIRTGGYTVLTPLMARWFVQSKSGVFERIYTDDTIKSPHAITERDRWMVKISDIVYTNLYNAKQISIGCVAELAWAHDAGKHTVVVMEPDNPHWHSFMFEMADIHFKTETEALDYLCSLGTKFNQ